MSEREELLAKAAQDFIDKVDRGAARSEQSYAAFKVALAAPQALAATPAVGGEARATAWRVWWVSLNTSRTELFENEKAADQKSREVDGCVIPLYAALPASPLRGREARLQLALIGVLDYERETAKLKGFSDCTCMGHSRSAENAYEMGECPHQVARVVLAPPPELPAARPMGQS